MKHTKQILALLLTVLMLISVVPLGVIQASATTYDSITLNVPWFAMRHASGCGISSLAMIEGYVKGYGDNDSTCYNAVYNYNKSISPNNPVYLKSYAKLGYSTKTNSLETIYNELKKGNPVMVYRTGSNHFSVVYGYTGSTSTLQKSGFKVKNTTHDSSYSALSWSTAKASYGADTNLEKWLSGSTWSLTLVRTADKIPLANKKQTVNITFNGNGGTPTKTSETFTVGEQYGEAFPSAVGREGYSFDGWYSAATGGSRYGRSSIATTGVKTLYAHWSQNTSGVLQVDHTYKIYNKGSNLPLQTNGSGAGCYVSQREESTASSQLWRVTSADENGYYRFESLNGGNALDMDADNTYGYRNHLQLWTPNTSNAQVFSLVKRSENAGAGIEYYSIHSKNSGRTCDVEGASTEPGAAVWQWDCHLSDNQLFYFVEIEDRELRFYDNLNNNYLPSPREVYEEEGTTTPGNCYSSRNTAGVTVTINPDSDALTIKQINPESSSDMKWVAAIGDSNVYGVFELDDTTVELHFKAKASVSGAKIWFRWGFDSTETGYYPVEMTTSWADYVLVLPRTRKSGNNLHPYIDKACTVEMKEIAMYAEGSQGYIGDTDAYSYKTIQSSVYDTIYTPLPLVAKEGYSFEGWYTKRVGGTKVADGEDYYDLSTLVGNQCLYAHWVKNEAHVHNYVKSVKTPTCTEYGYTTYVCSICGDSYSDNYISAIGHDYKASVKEATCTQAGYTVFTCDSCGDIYIGNEVEALGHNYIGDTISATCTKDGKTTFTCSRCNNSYAEFVNANGHQDDDDDGYCDLCSEELRPHDDPTNPTNPTNPTDPTNPTQPQVNVCKWCGKTHDNGFIQKIIGFFHTILANIFGAKY